MRSAVQSERDQRPVAPPPSPTQCGACGARLSSYNAGPNCYAHTLDIPWKGPGVRTR